MKKILILALALVMATGVLSACGKDGGKDTETEAGSKQETTAVTEAGTDADTDGESDTTAVTEDDNKETDAPADEATLADALAILKNLYRDVNETTERDYDLVAQVKVGSTTFAVTWACDQSAITIKESAIKGFWTVDLPDSTAEELAYVLTATITNAAGETTTYTMNRKVPVIDNSGLVVAPEANVAYKLFMKQASLGQTVYMTAEPSGTKYIKSTNDPKAAAEFFAEVVDGGFKFYTTIDGAKMYLNARAPKKDDGKFDKYLEFAAESECVWSYTANVNAWMTTIGDQTFVVGSYGDYSTFCISEASYINADNTGVSQFPLGIYTKEYADAQAPDKAPELPTEVTSIKDFLAIADALANQAATPEKYIVIGKIVEIKSTQYGNMNIEDAEGNKLYIYGLYDADGSNRYDKMNPQPKVGDTIKVMGVASQYNGSQMKNGWVLELIPGEGGGEEEKPETPAADKTIPAFNEIASAQPDKGDPTAEKYTVTGTITEIKNTQYGNLYIKDADGNQLYIYGIYSADGSTRFDKMDPQPKVGDTITVVGVACNYNGPQMKNGWVIAINGDSQVPEAPKPAEDKTIPAFNEIASAQPDKGDPTAEKYTVTGTITEIKNTQYGNLYIKDADGNQLYIYGIYSADGSTRFDKMDPQPKVGDTITVVGVACNYNGPQMKNGWVTKLTAAEGGGSTETPSEPTDSVSDLKEGTAYKIFLNQVKTGKVLYMTAEIDQGKFIVGTEDKAAGLDFYAEKVEGGYKFYTTIDGAKKYLDAHLELKDDGKTSKFLGYTDSTTNVWYYKADVNAWFVTIDGSEYVLGTYNTYNTFSISEARFITADNTGVSQFPGNFMVKG